MNGIQSPRRKARSRVYIALPMPSQRVAETLRPARVRRKNLQARNVLLLGLASLICGCEARLTPDEAGLLDAVSFVIGGQQEGALPQVLETRWRGTVQGSRIRHETMG